MMSGSDPSLNLYVYLQHPHSARWVTVGRYRLEAASGTGWFRYAPAYLQSGQPVPLDPLNLPLSRGEQDSPAQRYRGLHDVLRDACPDAWGQMLLARFHGLPEDAHPARFLALADNADRWGAVAVGAARQPPAARLSHPRLTQLDAVVKELQALAERRPALNAALRKRLVHRSSLGGARPKTTVIDAQGDCWLVKPGLATDTADIPALEHFAMRWASLAGLRIAPTVLHGTERALRVKRFDREAHGSRLMTLSAASLLQVEYPGATRTTALRSYPALCEAMRRVGVPAEDGRELFGRMVFNAVCGNDDDHVRNHALVYRADESRWRLAPGYDIVPNPDFTPDRLDLGLSTEHADISRNAVLHDAMRFGFAERAEAEQALEQLLQALALTFDEAAECLDVLWRQVMHDRLQNRLERLRAPPNSRV